MTYSVRVVGLTMSIAAIVASRIHGDEPTKEEKQRLFQDRIRLSIQILSANKEGPNFNTAVARNPTPIAKASPTRHWVSFAVSGAGRWFIWSL